MAKCCFPNGCRESENLIDPEEALDAVKVICNNENCTIGNWMHRSCFDEWEESVLSYLRSCGRARSWSEKQRLQNLWTKKGYDLAFKACDCKCGRGHLRKDLDYIQPTPSVEITKAKKKHKKKNDKPLPVVSTNHKTVNNQNHPSNHSPNTAVPSDTNGNTTSTPIKSLIQSTAHLRLRTDSVSSTGSSPPNSASSESPPNSASPLSNANLFLKGRRLDGMVHDHSHIGMPGNIFRRRQDLSAFSMLPKFKQNPYYIKMEDDGPHGNDDTRSFVLSNLSSRKMSSLRCVLCKDVLPVFDRYPLIDGTLFLSPQAYDEAVVQVIYEGRIQFLNACCVRCLDGHSDIRCTSCKKLWDGSALLLGTMYTYDIFAAMPCCQKRLTCKYCRRAVVDLHIGLNFYSQYSQMTICPYCKANDYHFIRPMTETFMVKESICGVHY
ncbi:hypothetical protein LOTGIDRAFT_106234 [Lottia gigantea]|uniref:Uncharacterized protein n=1 Tax=Lottia gigantea TaxID=225164 RepID=V3ZCW3_LOTGI|nr:hypothetical protein LOTGIDRAFT_106234 [Lottia gigantea]ESO88923.1 hypothetical protein LOTGIDRAFT_106234 [Lottia gigantea]